MLGPRLPDCVRFGGWRLGYGYEHQFIDHPAPHPRVLRRERAAHRRSQGADRHHARDHHGGRRRFNGCRRDSRRWCADGRCHLRHRQHPRFPGRRRGRPRALHGDRRSRSSAKPPRRHRGWPRDPDRLRRCLREHRRHMVRRQGHHRTGHPRRPREAGVPGSPRRGGPGNVLPRPRLPPRDHRRVRRCLARLLDLAPGKRREGRSLLDRGLHRPVHGRRGQRPASPRRLVCHEPPGRDRLRR